VSSTTALVLAIGLAAVFQMLFGELIPKNFAIADPERTLRWTVRLHAAFVAVLRPGIVVVDRLAAMAVRPFGLTPVDEIRRAVGAPELTALLDASREDGLIERFEHDLLTGVLDLGRQTASSVMVARSGVVAVDRRLPLVEVEEAMATSGHTRLPMLDRRTGEVVGMVHAKDLLRLPPEARGEPVPLESIRSLLVLHTDLLLDDVLQGLRRSRSQMAVVVDGSGSWVGVLSMDDVVEELVGVIPDESNDGA
jgi:CBS domain containing-hemolysin-like protein